MATIVMAPDQPFWFFALWKDSEKLYLVAWTAENYQDGLAKADSFNKQSGLRESGLKTIHCAFSEAANLELNSSMRNSVYFDFLIRDLHNKKPGVPCVLTYQANVPQSLLP